MDIYKLWIVTFNPSTNQFDIDNVERTLMENLDMLINHRDDVATQENWLTLFIHKDYSECQRFIQAVKKTVKTGNTPLENWLLENHFNISKN